MRYHPSILYSQPIPGLSGKLEAAIERGCRRADSSRPVELFFRADDIGVPSAHFHGMTALFQQHQMPLCLAVVPSWLTPARFRELRNITGSDDTLWCWHQHGRLHRNFETQGKKQEFGPARDFTTVRHHLQCGKERLETLLGAAFQPFFTPPWNRCSRDSVLALKELGFRAISRSLGARPDCSDILPDIQVNVDLHTRKDIDATSSLNALLAELESSLASGHCGIMLHHQRMNGHALNLLDLLLGHLSQRPELMPRLFSDLA
jgi:hypothetical protein